MSIGLHVKMIGKNNKMSTLNFMLDEKNLDDIGRHAALFAEEAEVLLVIEQYYRNDVATMTLLWRGVIAGIDPKTLTESQVINLLDSAKLLWKKTRAKSDTFERFELEKLLSKIVLAVPRCSLKTRKLFSDIPASMRNSMLWAMLGLKNSRSGGAESPIKNDTFCTYFDADTLASLSKGLTNRQLGWELACNPTIPHALRIQGALARSSRGVALKGLYTQEDLLIPRALHELISEACQDDLRQLARSSFPEIIGLVASVEDEKFEQIQGTLLENICNEHRRTYKAIPKNVGYHVWSRRLAVAITHTTHVENQWKQASHMVSKRKLLQGTPIQPLLASETAEPSTIYGPRLPKDLPAASVCEPLLWVQDTRIEKTSGQIARQIPIVALWDTQGARTTIGTRSQVKASLRSSTIAVETFLTMAETWQGTLGELMWFLTTT